MKKMVILGAGISGLAAAWFLRRRFGKNLEISILEKSARSGGWIQTVEKNGFLFELGPRGFRPTGRGQITLELIKELGLEKELVPANAKAKKRYILQNDKLRPFGLHFLFRQGLIGALLRDLKTSASGQEDETVADFVKRRLNKRFAETIADPLCIGIFGGDCDKLSMRSCFPSIWHVEQEKRSLLLGFSSKKRAHSPTALYTFKRGMEALPKALVEQLDCTLRLQTPVTSLEELDADYIISALPSHELCKMLGIEDPLQHVSLSTIHCGWNAKVLKQEGFGFLIPSKEKRQILGMTWDSHIFPQLNQGEHTRICIMVGGNHAEEALRERALDSLDHYLGIKIKPDVMLFHSAIQAIPQYHLLHHRHVEDIKAKIPKNMTVIGNFFDGVGINDCLFKARALINYNIFLKN